jgi:SAM-dependent methyltransferase
LEQQFWQDPTKVPEGIGPLPEGYRRACEPESYVGLGEISQYLAALVQAYVQPPATVLEPGCGVGRNLATLQDLGYRVKGIEINPRAVDLARRFFPTVAEHILLGPVEALLPRTQPVDVIVTQGFLMHVPYEHDEVLELIREKAQRLIVTNEVEHAEFRSSLKFPRTLRDYLQQGHWREVAHLTELTVPGIWISQTRVFKHGA